MALGAACSDGPTRPRNGTIRVTVQTSGGDPDADGYVLILDSDVGRPITAKDNTFLPDGTQRLQKGIVGLTPGAHSVALEGVADNCTVSGADQQAATVTAGGTVDVAFTVACAATGVAITAHTTGSAVPVTFDYDLLVDQALTSIAANGTLIVSRLQPGAHVVSLQVRAENCSVTGGAQTVTVTARTITPVRFDVTCLPPVRLEKIAYVIDSLVGGKSGKWIATVKPDGSGPEVLAPGDSPAWSPDGTRLVFSNTMCNSFDDYYGFACSGGLVSMDPETRTVTALGDGGSGFNPAWSPAGDVIAFTRCCEYGDFTKLYLLRVDGGPTVKLTIPGVQSVREPAWSPDGSRIAFTCIVAASNDVCVINRDGTGLVRLTNSDASESSAAWSPDGLFIAFGRASPGSTSQIVLVTPDGSNVTPLANGTGFEPAWSRDGSKLVFGGEGGLFTVSVDGLRKTRLTTGGHSEPAWRP
jgi:hypothetical protein